MPPLQSGVVTFLFTDIEGSIRLWERHPEAMRQALARHDALAATCIERYEGAIVKARGEGDSLFAVFARATDAVAAAVALQRALTAEPWPAETPLRVRMALHTGEANLRDGDYYGAAVNRCARLRATAHGGQTILSLTTAEVVRDALPAGVGLRDLGAHRLRDLQRPEHVFQVLHPDLPADFPELRSLNEYPNNLPLQLTSFIGREREMEAVKELLAGRRLLTLTGAGGTGKTRLSLQVAAEVLDQYPDGAWLVECAPVEEAEGIAQALAAVLGVTEEPGKSLLETLAEYLRSRHALLVLDNCEHLLVACAQLAETLLRHCPAVSVLASSREALNIPGETIYRLPSLSLPDPDRLPEAPESLAQFEAVRLFIDRALAASPSFSVTNRNAPAVAQICYQLDGIPLAIELAAARIKVLSADQIVARLDDRFRLLTGGSRTALPRQQTLRALIDWSYDLLNPQERVLLRRLSVFAGGWTLGAAEEVCGGEPLAEWEVLDLLTSLVDKSLVQYEERDEESRYRLLETVRQYARSRLSESGEAPQVQARHLAHFLRFAEEAAPGLEARAQSVWLARLERENDNLRVALNWAEREDATSAQRLAGALWWYWRRKGQFEEARERLIRVLAASDERTPARASALFAAGVIAWFNGYLWHGENWLNECMEICRELGEHGLLGRAVAWLALFKMTFGDQPQADALNREAIRLCRETGDTWQLSMSLVDSGHFASQRGEHDVARERFEEGLAGFRALGDQSGVALATGFLARNAADRGDAASARELFTESIERARALGDRLRVAMPLVSFGEFTLDQGDVEQAEQLFRESLVLGRELSSGLLQLSSLCGLAEVAARQGDLLRAVRYLAFEEGVRARAHYAMPRPCAEERARYLEAAAEQYGREAVAQAVADARAVPWEQVVAYALGESCPVAFAQELSP